MIEDLAAECVRQGACDDWRDTAEAFMSPSEYMDSFGAAGEEEYQKILAASQRRGFSSGENEPGDISMPGSPVKTEKRGFQAPVKSYVESLHQTAYEAILQARDDFDQYRKTAEASNMHCMPATRTALSKSGGNMLVDLSLSAPYLTEIYNNFTPQFAEALTIPTSQRRKRASPAVSRISLAQQEVVVQWTAGGSTMPQSIKTVLQFLNDSELGIAAGRVFNHVALCYYGKNARRPALLKGGCTAPRQAPGGVVIDVGIILGSPRLLRFAPKHKTPEALGGDVHARNQTMWYTQTSEDAPYDVFLADSGFPPYGIENEVSIVMRVYAVQPGAGEITAVETNLSVKRAKKNKN